LIVAIKASNWGSQVAPDDDVAKTFSKALKSSISLHASVKLTAIAIILMQARLLNLPDFGTLAAWQAFALLCSALWDGGLGLHVTQRLASGVGGMLTIRSALRARLLLLPLPVIAFLLAVRLLPPLGSISLRCCFLLQGLFAATAMLLSAAERGRHRFGLAVFPTILGRLVQIGLTASLFAVTPTRRLMLVPVVLLAGEITSTAVGFLQWYRRGDRMPAGADEHAVSALRSARYFWYSSAMFVLYNKFDVAVVSLAGGSVVAALYAPASRIQDVLAALPAMAATAIIPVAASMTDVDSRRRLVALAVRKSGRIALPLMVCTMVGAPIGLTKVLGADFSPSVFPVQILALSVLFTTVSAPQMALLTATNRRRALSFVTSVGFVTSVLCQYIGAKLFGLVGASAGALIREPVMLLFALRANSTMKGDGS
jgi:O-antigen/teichoic acid export membrane protein